MTGFEPEYAWLQIVGYGNVIEKGNVSENAH